MSKEEDLGEDELLSFEDVSLVYVRSLRLLGLLPFEGRDYDFIGTRVLLVYFFLASLANSSMFACFCLNSRELHVDAIAESVITVGVAARFHVMISKRHRLERLVHECASIWTSCGAQARQTVRRFERKLRNFMRLFVVSACFINVLYPVNALITSHQLTTLSANNGTETQRILPFRWFADDMEEHWPGYWPTFFLQMLIVQSAVIIGCTTDATPYFLIILGAGYSRQLYDQLHGGLQLMHHHSANRLQLVRFIIFHQKVLRYCARLEKFFRTIMLIQLLSTGYNISLVLFKLVSPDRDKYKYISLLGVCLCQLFLCQWTSDHLFNESMDLSIAAYFASADWMMRPRRMGKHLLMIIMRAQRPVQMTAGGIVNLSLQNFGSMLTSAFSFFTVLRNVSI